MGIFDKIINSMHSKRYKQINEEIEGGRKVSHNYDAPKVIQSNEIVFFDCSFSAINLDAPECELTGYAYGLDAKLKDEKVIGTYFCRSRFSYDAPRLTFQTGKEFLVELQKIVARHNLAQHNGLSVHVYGLPDEYGAYLSIKYASKESIYASDNQSCFLSLEAMEDLEQLFRKQVDPDPVALEIVIKEESITKNENGNSLTISYPILTLASDQGYAPLVEALNGYNEKIKASQQALLINSLQQEPRNLRLLSQVYTTRSDDRLVSFYEITIQKSETVNQEEVKSVRSFNYDAKSGEKLLAKDVFNEEIYYKAYLSELLETAFMESDPYLYNVENLAAYIEISLQDDDGIICFALTDEGVCFYANRERLGVLAGVGKTMLLYKDHPRLLKKYYRPCAKKDN